MTQPQNAPTIESIKSMYGNEALELCCIVSGPDDNPILIPKMRENMTTQQWLALDQSIRVFVLNEFYNSL